MNHIGSDWPIAFAKVIACTACSSADDQYLLRDTQENVPQPGYVGPNYEARRVLLVGQNPGVPGRLAEADRRYTQALRLLRDSPNAESYAALARTLKAFVPMWPVSGSYFPLAECGLALEDIAYTNIVRCRTQANRAPKPRLTQNCITNHFAKWLDILQPRVVVFIGKWASDQASWLVGQRGVPHAFMNRQRSLSSVARIENRQSVVALVKMVANVA